MAAVAFQGISKSYGGFVALSRLDLRIGSGEFMTLLGPSGSGKTTLLNIVAGMVAPTTGAVLIDGEDVTAVPPRKRGLGMVFQNYALMPHMSVFENVAFPLRVRKLSRGEIERRVMAVLETVHLAPYARRKPRELSGGQQQRVSIARCLVYEPKLVLMDEPLGALDKRLREQLQLEIKRIHKELGVTVLYVTHDQEEALVLSDRITVMSEGRIEQVGKPDELYFHPATEFVAQFLGASNLIPARIESVAGDVATLVTESGLTFRAGTGGAGASEGRVKALVRPEAIRLEPAAGAAGHGLDGVVLERIFVGQTTKYVVAVGDLSLHAHLGSGAGVLGFGVGERVRLAWQEEDARLVAPR
jgi:putative spermidine/putrescine transport system ATP-binding protein